MSATKQAKKKIADRNPRVDLAKVEKAGRYLDERRKRGRERRRYNIASPHDRTLARAAFKG